LSILFILNLLIHYYIPPDLGVGARGLDPAAAPDGVGLDPPPPVTGFDSIRQNGLPSLSAIILPCETRVPD
jgi:hypothetical protein